MNPGGQEGTASLPLAGMFRGFSAVVIEWLKRLENTERRQAATQGRKPCDTDWLWQESGLRRPR